MRARQSLQFRLPNHYGNGDTLIAKFNDMSLKHFKAATLKDKMGLTGSRTKEAQPAEKPKAKGRKRLITKK